MKMIKLSIYSILFSIFLASCGNNEPKESRNQIQNEAKSNKEITLALKTDKFDFGDIKASEKEFISTVFEFENIGENPIVIQKADVSCGCVSVKYDETPVLKGKMGKIEVTLDVKQLDGYFDKKVFVKSNATNDVELLRVTGTVTK